MPARPQSRVAALSKNSEYKRVYRKGALLKGETLWIYYLPVPDKNIRVGTSISRRVTKKSSQRSRFKRIIKEWFRQHAGGILWYEISKSIERDSNHFENRFKSSPEAIFLKSGAEIVIVVKKDAPLSKTGSAAIRQELATLLTP